MNIFVQLKTEKNLTDSEQQVAQFILNDPVSFLYMSTEQIARACYTSVPTLYRLCSKLGADGMADLKVKISASLNDYLVKGEEFDFNYPVRKNQNYYEVTKSLQEDYEKTVALTCDLFDLDQLRYSVSAMKSAKHIDVYTSAGNVYFAENFNFKCRK